MCLRLLKQLLMILNLNLEDKYVKEFCAKAEAELRFKRGTRHWLSPNTLLAMENLRKEVDLFVDHQKRIKKYIVLQSLARGHLARKKVKKLRGYMQSPHKERNALFRELIKNERMYISRLSLMVKGYMQPLKSTNTKLLSFSHILPVDDISAIFANTEVLLKVHTGILGEFEMLLDKWPVIEQVGAVFLKKAPELKGYGEYVKNFKNALDTLIRSQENNQKFAQFLAERGVASDDPGLMALISCPLNQISQYEILLERLSKATPTGHPDSGNLSAASQIMRESYKLIQDAINQSHDRAKILDVQRRLLPGQLDHELTTPERVFISEGAASVLDKKSKKTSRYYFLFNDILILSKQHKTQYKVKHIISLKDLIIEEFSNSSQLPTALDPLCCCNLIVPKVKLTAVFSTKTEKSDLVQKLRTIVEKLNPNTKVFGLSLVELQKREKGTPSTIPTILTKMADRIKLDIKAEGIFRISCSNANLVELRDKLEKDDEVDFSKYEVHTVTSALKLFFREMPEPLFTFMLYDDLLSIADNTSLEERITALKPVIKKLPRPNYEVLAFVCEFLTCVAQHSEQNKMTVSNLAIVFGPNLIKPPVVSIESTLMIPKANSVFEDVLGHFEQVMETKNSK